MSLDWQILQTMIDASPDGVVVCDATAAGYPVMYANRAFEALSGYSAGELHGKNFDHLHQAQPQQEALHLLRAALQEGLACRVTLCDQRADGTPFLNDMQLLPIRNAQGELTHFASFHRTGNAAASSSEAPSDPLLNTQRLLAYVRDDKLTGLLRRSYFEDLLRRDFALAQRESKVLTVLVFGIDHAESYREVFGASGAEQTFKRVARTVAACFRRNSDLCARWEDTEIVTATMTTPPDKAAQLAELVMARVRDLAIHHPRSSNSRFVTVSAGVVSEVPQRTATAEQFIARALQALGPARNRGTQRVSLSA